MVLKHKLLGILIVVCAVQLSCAVLVDEEATATAIEASIRGTLTAQAPTNTPTPTPTRTHTPTPSNTPTPTTTPTPTETPTETPTPTPEPEVFLTDDFADTDSFWFFAFGPDPDCGENVDGTLVLTAQGTEENPFSICQVGYNGLPANFAATVNIIFDESSTEWGEAGMVFRVTTNGDDLEFFINHSRQFAIYKYLNGDFTDIVGYTSSNRIDGSPGAVNQLTVLADGAHLTFLINGAVVEEIEQATPTGRGFGLVVYSFDALPTTAYFDDLIITNLTGYYLNPPALP